MKKIVIVGSTGLVGSELLKCINENNKLLKNYEIIQVSSQRNVNNNNNLQLLEKYLDDEPKIYINCANNETAEKISKYLKDSILIDNSSAFRMNPQYPLVIPEINMDNNKIHKIYASPNCCVIILALLLYCFTKNNIEIKKVDVSTYQSASGAGIVGYNELILQTNQYSNNQQLTTDFWKRQYIHNVFCHNTPITSDDGYNNEEEKMIQEIPKIFNKNIPVNPTCIRVPTLRSHCLSVNLTFNRSLTYNDILKNLEDENIIVLDDKINNNFPDSLISNNDHKIYVGHIRKDIDSDGYRWNFFVSGDQLKRGAAYNVYVILLKLLEYLS